MRWSMIPLTPVLILVLVGGTRADVLEAPHVRVEYTGITEAQARTTRSRGEFGSKGQRQRNGGFTVRAAPDSAKVGGREHSGRASRRSSSALRRGIHGRCDPRPRT